jgi:hypothetical protein
LHLPLSSPRWSMRVLGSIIQISALPMLDAREQLSLSDTIAPQLIGHDHPRFILQTLQQPIEEALRRLGIAPGLNKDVEHNSMLIDGPPEIMLDALDTDEDLIHVPLVAGSWPTPAQSVGKTRCKFLAPAPHRLVGDEDTAFRQDQLDIPETEAEHVVQPDGVADDLSCKRIRSFCGAQPPQKLRWTNAGGLEGYGDFNDDARYPDRSSWLVRPSLRDAIAALPSGSTFWGWLAALF